MEGGSNVWEVKDFLHFGPPPVTSELGSQHSEIRSALLPSHWAGMVIIRDGWLG